MRQRAAFPSAHRRPVLAVLAVMLAAAAFSPSATAQDSAASAGAKERIRQTLLYGIDSQVLDAIHTIESSRDTSYTHELSAILSDDRSADLQKAVLDVFRDQKVPDGDTRARAILASWETSPEALLIAAIQYEGSLGGAGIADALKPIVDSSSDAVALEAIQALGATGDASAGPFLVEKLKSPDVPDSRKNAMVLALGALKAPDAVTALIAIASNTDEDKIRRMYAADSLGKIHDPKALPVLRSMLAENDALIRLYAASALSQFSLEEVFPNLIQGLRDEDPRVRELSAKSLARPLDAARAAEAVPILSYKAEFDPQGKVRIASIKALGAIGGDKALGTLLRIYSGPDHPLDSRQAALEMLASKDLSGSLEAIRSVIKAEWSSFDSRALESTAKVLSTTRGAGLKEIFTRFLDSRDPVVRSYGARGIALNGFSELKERLKKMAEQDPNPGTRREASVALEKL